MTNELYLTARALINKACPELLKLEFGCEVEYPELLQIDVDDFTSGIAIIVGERDSDVIMGYTANRTISSREYRTFVFNEKDEHKILGREPRLADVLRAIALKMGNDDLTYLVTDAGLFVKEVDLKVKNISDQFLADWPLTTDRLSDCSEETLRFIIGVLSK